MVLGDAYAFSAEKSDKPFGDRKVWMPYIAHPKP